MIQPPARGENLQTAKKLLGVSATADGASKVYEGRTALHAAAANGHVEIVKALLKAGAQVNIVSRHRSSALESACEDERMNVVDVGQGRTALQATVAKAEHLQAALRAKTDFNALSGPDSGRTALQAAEEGGHMAVVAQLIRAGAKRTG